MPMELSELRSFTAFFLDESWVTAGSVPVRGIFPSQFNLKENLQNKISFHTIKTKAWMPDMLKSIDEVNMDEDLTTGPPHPSGKGENTMNFIRMLISLYVYFDHRR